MSPRSQIQDRDTKITGIKVGEEIKISSQEYKAAFSFHWSHYWPALISRSDDVGCPRIDCLPSMHTSSPSQLIIIKTRTREMKH